MRDGIKRTNLFDAAALTTGRRGSRPGPTRRSPGRRGVVTGRRHRQVAALTPPLQRRYQRQFTDSRTGDVDVIAGFDHHRLVRQRRYI